MQITRNSLETDTGPSEWFTGTVYIDAMATASEPSRLTAINVHFTPGARTAWRAGSHAASSGIAGHACPIASRSAGSSSSSLTTGPSALT